MKPKHRIREGGVFRRVFTKGRRSEFRYLRIIFLKNSLGLARISVVIPKAVDKRAVVRNKLRRRILEWIRIRSAVLNLPIDLIMVLKKGAASVARKELYEELDRAVNPLGRI